MTNPPTPPTPAHKADTGYGSEINDPQGKPLNRAFHIIAHATPPKARHGRRLTICPAAELPPGQRRIVDVGPFSIGIFNLDGNFHAVKNVCPHYGAPLCQGSLHATHKPSDPHTFDPAYPNQILRCPWHGWEFDIVTGKGLYDATSRVATYPVEIDPEGNLILTL